MMAERKKGEQNDEQAGNSYNGNKPSADTIVFRSYKDPDETSSTLTKLKVEYVNTVKTGGLKIKKKAAAGEEDTIKGTYTFKVTFNDVGGEGLEEKPIDKIPLTIDMSDTAAYHRPHRDHHRHPRWHPLYHRGSRKHRWCQTAKRNRSA